MKFHVSLAFIIVCAGLFIIGCKKDKSNSGCFKLKSVYLYQGSNTACSSNIWQVEYSPDIEIPRGSYIQFTTNGEYDLTGVKIADILYLKLTMKVKFVPGIDPFCPYNVTYLLQGDLCK